MVLYLCAEQAYLEQTQQVKAANVGLYGIGAQCHFGNEEQPDEGGIKVSPRQTRRYIYGYTSHTWPSVHTLSLSLIHI